MDQVKIGCFIKELRKGKSLTQEQLAERLNVSRRTVSRWDTGSNVPDLDVLIEMADYYDVDLRELLDGERKSGEMNKEIEETLLKVADYSNDEKQNLMKRMHWLFIVGLIGFSLSLLIQGVDLENTPPYEGIAGFGLGIAFGMLVLGVVFTSQYAARLRAFKMRLLKRQQF